jgi:hypothetical protein
MICSLSWPAKSTSAMGWNSSMARLKNALAVLAPRGRDDSEHQQRIHQKVSSFCEFPRENNQQELQINAPRSSTSLFIGTSSCVQ